MSIGSLWNLGTPYSLWGVNVLLQTTVVALFAIAASQLLRRSPTLRYGVLLSGLLLTLLTPITANVMQRSARSWLSVSLAPATVDTPPITAAAIPPVSAPPLSVTQSSMPNQDAEATGRISERDLRGGQQPFSAGPFDEINKRRLHANSVELSLAFDEANNSSESLEPAVSSAQPTTTWARFVLQTVIFPLLLIWLAGTSFALLKLARGCCRVAAILHSAKPHTDLAISESMVHIARLFELRRPPLIVLSDEVSGPISAGWMRPCVVLPSNFAGRVTPEQLRDVLIHEVAHVVRHDPTIVLLQNLIAALFWFHPLVAAMNRQLAQAREEVCDNYVLAATDAPSYSRTLLTLAELTLARTPLAATVGLFASSWRLESRVAGLLDKRRNRGTRLSRRGWTFVGLNAVAIAVLTAFGTVSVAVDQKENNTASEDAEQRAVADPSDEFPDDGLLTLNLTVLMPDGSPAAGANVELLHQYQKYAQTLRADHSGKVVIRSVFGMGARVHARSADEAFQATLKEVGPDARLSFAKPVQLTLAPAITHTVTVVADEKPAAGVDVVAMGHFFKSRATTNSDGVAALKLPADDALREVIAWHAELGATGVHGLDERPPQNSTRLSLLAPAPLTIRVVDQHGDPVPDLKLGIFTVVEEADWFNAGEIEAAHVQTNQAGEAVVDWAPRDNLKYIDGDLISPDWKEDEWDQETIKQRIVTVHVRRLVPVEGRLIMPDGVSAQGILVTGSGFGPFSYGDAPWSRARKDGSFTLPTASDHGYVLGVFDREWASERWSGLILEHDDDVSAEVEMSVSPAIPLTVRVTRGTNHDPVPTAWVELEQKAQFEWTNAAGERQNAEVQFGGWLKTGPDGIARAGIGLGKSDVRVSTGEWDETRQLKVNFEDPIDIEFHRPWKGKRRVTAKLTSAGEPYHASAKLHLSAWTEKKEFELPAHHPVVIDDETIAVEFDQETLSLLIVDQEQKKSGFVKVGPDDDEVELEMESAASYSGILVDENGQPLAGRLLRLMPKRMTLDSVTPERTDLNGRFLFPVVAVNHPLWIDIEDEGQGVYSAIFSEMQFKPGEIRENSTVQALTPADGKQAARPARPFNERLNSTFENVRVAGMCALVVLQGDNSKNVMQLTDRLLGDAGPEADDDDLPVYAYLPITLPADQLPAESKQLKDRNWPLPDKNQIVLIAFDVQQRLFFVETVSADDVDAGVKQANEFLQQHRPPLSDGREKLAEARQLAQQENRRIWIITSGPRCGPCFQLARWIDQHRELLTKDYVIVKLMSAIDEHADEIREEIGGAEHGIPWHVITEPDGKILVTSEGPLGNIGMPSSIEGIRHFREMLEQTAQRLTSAEIESLVGSLSTND